MISRYAFIVPCTKNYLHELRPLLRSIKANNPEIPVFVLTTNLVADDLKEADGSYINENATLQDLPDYPEWKDKPNYEFRRIRTSRFLIATQIAEAYDVVCILDADMALLRPVDKFFKMAETGTILVGGNNTLLRFIKKDMAEFGIDVSDDFNVVHPTFCTVPVFINPKIQRDYLLAIWNNPTGNDLDVPNRVAEQMGKMPEIFLLNTYAWLNIHHSMLKPETHVTETSDGLYSHQGEPVYMMHGHWGEPKYVECLLEPMEKNYGWHKPYIDLAKNCIAALSKAYEKYTKNDRV